jgi:PAS domain S-box-containing protein
MKRELEMLNSLFEFATEGIIICDTSGTIRMSNPAGEKMFGYSENELRGNKIEILLPPRYHHKHVDHRENFVKKPEPRAMGVGRNLFGKRKDGTEIMLEVSLSPFKTTEGDFVMSFVVDVTGRKKSEMDLQLAHERLQQTTDALSLLNTELETKVKERTEELAVAIQRLALSKRDVMQALEKEKDLNELKSRFVTTASHEFRTPLATILSSVSLIARYDSNADSEKREKHISRIKSSVNNLTQILNDFLSIEKLEEGIVHNNPVKFNFAELVTEVSEDLRGISKKGQTIAVEYSGSEEITLDPQLMKNVMINLVSNAIKYSPEEKEIEINVEVDKKNLRVDIVDHGIGIPEEDQHHLFERFFRAKNSGNAQGTGLGLNIVKKYVELMDGEISFVSSFNEGSTFTISIPLF